MKPWNEQGGSAFPIPHSNEPGAYENETGMSLRDWFAGQALAGLMANCDSTGMNGWIGVDEAAAEVAYKAADAMLEARK